MRGRVSRAKKSQSHNHKFRFGRRVTASTPSNVYIHLGGCLVDDSTA